LTSFSTLNQIMQYLARRDQQQLIIIKTTGLEFEVCSKIKMCLACINGDWLVEIWAEICTVYDSSGDDDDDNDDNDNDNNNDDGLPTVEEIFYTAL
jgi:hypothetical protein